MWMICFFCNDTATTEIYTLSLHDALPISYGDPWIAAVALVIALAVIDRIVRPRNQSYG